MTRATAQRSTVLKAHTDSVVLFETTALASEPVNGLLLDDRLVSEAREAGFRAGFDAGYTAGRDEGLQAAAATVQQAEAARAEQLRPAVSALAHAATQLDAHQAVIFSDVEEALATAAFLLTEALLGRELQLTESPGRDAVARALQLAPERLPVTIYLNPTDAGTIAEVSDLAPGRDVTVAASPGVMPGDARVEVGSCRVDAVLADAVDRVRDALGVTR